jgi:hypothetical protein
MKIKAIFLVLLSVTFSLSAQEQKVEIVPKPLLEPIQTESIEEVILSRRVVSSGVAISKIPYDYHLPFKVYYIPNNNWVLQQDIYNSLQVYVPSLRVTNRNDTAIVPKFSIRGDDDTVVIVDGVQFDASVLNTINPADIESIKVALSDTARNYFLSNSNF